MSTHQRRFCANPECRHSKDWNTPNGVLQYLDKENAPTPKWSDTGTHQTIDVKTIGSEVFARWDRPSVQICSNCAAVAKALLLYVF